MADEEGKEVVPEQMELMDDSMLPLRPDVEELVASKSCVGEAKKVFTYSGKLMLRRVLSCPELAEGVCTALMMGLSVRLIAKRFGLSTRSVINCRKAMTDRGELASVRSRVAQKLDLVIEQGLERWLEGILDGTIHPGQLPIPTLAALDKKAAIDAGLVGDTGVGEAELLLRQVRAAKELYDLAQASASDTPSTGSPADVVDVESSTVAPDASATGSATALPAAAPAWEPPVAPTPAALDALEAETGRGGSDSPAPPRDQSKSFGKF